MTDRCPRSARPGPGFAGRGACHHRREFAAEFSCHCPLYIFQDSGREASIVLKLLSTVVNGDTGFLTREFVIGALIRVLKAAPTTYVVHKDLAELDVSIPDIINQALQGIAAV